MRAILLIAALVLVLGGATVVYRMTRGVRNNNPGNLRASAVQWRGQKGADEYGFAKFDTAENGLRALAKNLRNQQLLHGLRTVRAIVTKYAPGNENDTESYISHVADALGVQPDTTINLRDRATLSAFVQAVVIHENGVQPYTLAQIDTAAAVA